MASNTDTLSAETTAPAREPLGPPKARRGALTWAAVIGAGIAVVALAAATLTGGNDDRDFPTPRFNPRAEQYERQAHLDGLAKIYGQDRGAVTPSETGNQSAWNPQAEQHERQAHLDGLAKTYGKHPADTPTPAEEADTPDGQEFVPGSRHMPSR
jgi:hypothetical protein